MFVDVKNNYLVTTVTLLLVGKIHKGPAVTNPLSY